MRCNTPLTFADTWTEEERESKFRPGANPIKLGFTG